MLWKTYQLLVVWQGAQGPRRRGLGQASNLRLMGYKACTLTIWPSHQGTWSIGVQWHTARHTATAVSKHCIPTISIYRYLLYLYLLNYNYLAAIHTTSAYSYSHLSHCHSLSSNTSSDALRLPVDISTTVTQTIQEMCLYRIWILQNSEFPSYLEEVGCNFLLPVAPQCQSWNPYSAPIFGLSWLK